MGKSREEQRREKAGEGGFSALLSLTTLPVSQASFLFCANIGSSLLFRGCGQVEASWQNWTASGRGFLLGMNSVAA